MTETKRLQDEIKKLIRKLRWSQARAADAYRCHESDDDSPTAPGKFREKLKKWLSRPSTKPELLEPFLTFLEREHYRKQNQGSHIVPTFVPGDAVDRGLIENIRDISKDLDRKVRTKRHID